MEQKCHGSAKRTLRTTGLNCSRISSTLLVIRSVLALTTPFWLYTHLPLAITSAAEAGYFHVALSDPHLSPYEVSIFNFWIAHMLNLPVNY
uniref:Uncharacterized protein n=1 Tax=Kalanchoe fedtschenkoi TaxID=63787 RepID=A0A7N0ZZJ4_KALFE